MSALTELFPDEDYRFHLTLRRGDPGEFFAPGDASAAVLAQRRDWLRREPGRYLALQPHAELAVEEFARMASAWPFMRARGGHQPAAPGAVRASATPAWSTLNRLGETLESDVLFLVRDADPFFRLRGGALCFPTGWALEDKLGLTMDEIHGVVPGLNTALSSPIQQFLNKLRPGTAFLRDNWGLAATSELNLHPARRIPAPQAPAALDRLWLRVEYQILFVLPESMAVAFGIRIALFRLDELVGTPVAAGLRRALATMPEEMAAYKRLDGVRAGVIRLLEHP